MLNVTLPVPNRPGLVPGAKVPPFCTVTALLIVPVPFSVVPAATVTLDVPSNEPFTVNVPALSAVAPV